MANPQTENGFVRIATAIMDRLCKMRIPGEARQVLDFVIRKTWGFNKKSDIISVSQFVEGTGLSRQHVYRARLKLEKMNLIRTQKGSTGMVSYSFQKDYDQWKGEPKKVHEPKKVRGGTKEGSNRNPIGDSQYTIDTITIDNKSTSKLRIQEFIDCFEKHCPTLPTLIGEPGATRKRTIKARLTEHPGMDWWVDLFKKVEASDFLTGKVKDWKANFDWILKPANLQKIQEGVYDNGKSKPKPNVGHTSGKDYGPTGSRQF